MTVDACAQLSPGASGVGVLTVGDTTLSTGSGLVIDLDPTNGENDVLNVKGTVALSGADLVLDLLGRTRFPGSSEGDNVVGMFDGHTYGFHIDYDSDGGAVGNDIRLTAVPEPAT
jgi:hypothetical protein